MGCGNVLQPTFETSVVVSRKGVSIVMKAKRSEKGGLVITRKECESFQLFDRRDGSFTPIVITQQKVHGNRSSLHINAPEYIGIVRSELAVKGESESC